MPLAVIEMEQSEAPIFGGILKICRDRYYELSPSACVQNFGSIGHLRDLELFSEISLAPVEVFNNGMPWSLRTNGDKLL